VGVGEYGAEEEEDNIKTDRKEICWEVQSGLIWLRRWTSGGLLLPLYRTSGFHKMQEFLD